MSWLSRNLAKLGVTDWDTDNNITSNITGIKAVTDNLPDSGSLNDLTTIYKHGRLRIDKSTSSSVPINGIFNVSLSIYDSKIGKIPSADIDISSIVSYIGRSKYGGGSSSNISIGVWNKVDGRIYAGIYLDPSIYDTFDSADIYIEGVVVTLNGLSIQLPRITWRAHLMPNQYDLDTDIDGIKSVTDNLPDSGALTTLSSNVKGLIYKGTCDAGMTGSQTSIVSGDLSGYGDDFFNDKFYLAVLKNANSVGNAPEMEIKQITDYVSSTGTFTTNSFSVNIEENDSIQIIHESIAKLFENFSSASVTNNFDGNILKVLKAGLEKSTGGAFDPDQDSNEAIRGEIDNIKGNLEGVLSNGTLSFDETLATDQSVATLSAGTRRKIWAIHIDGTNITQSTTAKIFIDLGATATDQRELEDYQTTIAAGKSVNIMRAQSPLIVDTDFELKLSCAGGGGGSVDVYYRIIYEDMQ